MRVLRGEPTVYFGFGGFADEWSKANSDSEQIERNARMCKERNSESVEQIQEKSHHLLLLKRVRKDSFLVRFNCIFVYFNRCTFLNSLVGRVNELSRCIWPTTLKHQRSEVGWLSQFEITHFTLFLLRGKYNLFLKMPYYLISKPVSILSNSRVFWICWGGNPNLPT